MASMLWDRVIGASALMVARKVVRPFWGPNACEKLSRSGEDRLAQRIFPERGFQFLDLHDLVDAAVEENTDLEVSEVADQIVDKCVQSAGGRRRLTCLVEESSEEWMARRGSLPPNYNELKHELRGSRNHPRYVLILSAAAAEAGDRRGHGRMNGDRRLEPDAPDETA